jgi:predicted XRE-type DNA-binding protein
MYRHLGGAPPGLQSMQPDEQKSFFKDVGSQVKVTPKNARWALVRAAMIKSITHYKKEQQLDRVQRKYLPLGVLEKKGYDVDAIVRHGDKRVDEVTELSYAGHLRH